MQKQKLNLEWIMTKLGIPFRKKFYHKIEKLVKFMAKMPHVNKKPLARKPIFFIHRILHLLKN